MSNYLSKYENRSLATGSSTGTKIVVGAVGLVIGVPVLFMIGGFVLGALGTLFKVGIGAAILYGGYKMLSK